MRKRFYTDNQLQDAVKTSFSFAEVIKKLGLKSYSGNFPSVKKRIISLCLDYSHFLGRGHLFGKSHSWTHKRPIKYFLKRNNARISRTWLKSRLIKEGFLKNLCSICGLLPLWNNKKLVLVIDHINGNKFDYRLKNLRLLCPNCNSQTETFASKNISLRKKISDKTILKNVKCFGYTKIAKEYGIQEKTLKGIVNNIRRELLVK